MAEYYPAPNETRMKSLVQGEKARPQGPGRTLINDARVENYRTNGEPEVIIEAPECLLDQNHHTMNSAGPLKVKTADGKFLIEGEGFLWLQTNSTLFISNKVHTIAHRELMATGETNSSVAATEASAKEIEIFSDSFEYAKESGLGVYHDNVRAVGTNLTLATKTMTLILPMKDRQLESVTADNDVVMDYEGIHATGDHGNYVVATGMAHVTGNPAWKAEAREGKGDELIIDRTNKIFTAEGHAYLKMPAASMGSAGFIPKQQAEARKSDRVATNGFVEIVSDRYVVMTNLAVFQNKVRVTETEDQQPKGGMSCSLLTVRFVGTNQLENMLAETNVVIEQRENDTTNQFVAARAFYTATNNIMELTGAPAWRAGLREGKADLLLVNLQNNTLDARSNAWMRLPASELGESLPGSASKDTAGTVAKTNEFADVYSHEYTVSPENAFFHDHVRILHPSMNWTCEEVSVAFPAEAGTNAIPQNVASQKKISMMADRRVVFVLTDPSSGQKVNGTSDTAYYDYVASAKGTNDVLRLTGNPILTTTNGTVKNKIIILDNTSKKLIAPGKYVIYGTVAGRTNAFQMPKM